jgi:hypothetical protein
MSRIRLLIVVAVVVPACFAASAREATQVLPVNHFQCYRVDPGGTFTPKTVVLSTQFGTVKAVPSQFQTLCAPVRKNNSEVVNARAHLACYPIKAPPFTPRKVFVTNQFETAAPLVVVAPKTLCVPSGKSIVPAPPPPLVKGLDNYECFSVKPQQTPHVKPVTLVDQFGKSVAAIGLPVALCAPARKDNEPVYNRVTHLVCYAITARPALVPRHVTIRNSFGTATGTVFARQTLCLPSTKKLG